MTERPRSEISNSQHAVNRGFCDVEGDTIDEYPAEQPKKVV